MVHNLNLLAELPLPLATGKRPLYSAVDCIAHDVAPPRPQNGSSLATNDQPADLDSHLVTARSLGLNEQEWKKYRERNRLIHLHHEIWIGSNQPITRATRAQSLAMIAPTDYLYRIRFSRLSAAWVLGYTPQFPEGRIDIDYSRDNRCNLPRAYRALFATHQTTVIPYDCINIGPIKVTTPLRTAVDLVSYHDELEHLNAVQAILRDPQNTVSPRLFLKVLADKPNLRRSSYLRAEHLVQECLKDMKNTFSGPQAGFSPPQRTRPARRRKGNNLTEGGQFPS